MSPPRHYDLVIVGAGLVGGLLAAEATSRGRTVALIEAGQRFEFANRPLQIRDRQIMGVPIWQYAHAERDRFTDSSADSIGYPYQLESHRLKGVGGSTLHWGGRINRLLPTDFRSASLFGTAVDWPISYDDLEPYYCRADWELGVSGTHHPALPPRSRDYPNPGFPVTVDDAMWQPVAERLGIQVYPTSFAINSQPYGGRGRCVAMSSCEACPSGARYSADVHVARAERSGLCDLFTNTVARKIDLSASASVKAIHVSTLDHQEREISGRDYVVAAHAVESARLLLLSNCGNHSDQVGRNFMEHPYVYTSGHLPNQRFYPGRLGFEILECLSYYYGPDRRETGAVKLEFVFSDRDPLGDMERRHIWGKALARYDRANFGHWMGIAAETEHQPNPESRVSLDPAVKDIFGDPVPHIHLAFSEIDHRTQQRAREVSHGLMGAAGVKDIVNDPQGSNTFSGHHMGTCRMADDPNRGVVDRNCRVHGVDNLYVVGGSVFPTVGAMQPSLTIAALALRAADHLCPV